MNKKFKMLSKFFQVSLLFIVMIFLLQGCSNGNGDKGKSVSTGILKTPVQNLNPKPSNSNLDLFVDLPLLLWPSFEYNRITNYTGQNHQKVEHCLITESEGAQLQPGTKVEIIDEARCFYVLLNSKDGIPKPYTITLVQIRLIETGEEGWTWSKAIELDK